MTDGKWTYVSGEEQEQLRKLAFNQELAAEEALPPVSNWHGENARLLRSLIDRDRENVRRAAAEAARGMLGCDPGRSFTDELIAERRAEARG